MDTKKSTSKENHNVNTEQQKSVGFFEKKDSLKQKLILNYLKLPKFIFESENSKIYNDYKEFVELDSLLNVYSIREDLTLKEKQLLGIYKFKRNLLTSDYDKALGEFEELPLDLDIETYKILLKGIAHLLKDESLLANEHFQKILEQFNVDEIEKNGMCDKYYLINALLGRGSIEVCENHVQSYKDFFSIGNIEIIREYVLNDIEL